MKTISGLFLLQFHLHTSSSISATLGTLCSVRLENEATNSTYSVLLARGRRKTPWRRRKWLTHALLDRFNILKRNTDASSSSQMPGGLQWQVLDHDSGQNNQLGLDGTQNRVVGQVQPIGNLLTKPYWKALEFGQEFMEYWEEFNAYKYPCAHQVSRLSELGYVDISDPATLSLGLDSRSQISNAPYTRPIVNFALRITNVSCSYVRVRGAGTVKTSNPYLQDSRAWQWRK